MMVAAVSGAASTTDPQNPTIIAGRQPLFPAEKDNTNGISNNSKKPKSRIVSSRYMSPSTSTPTSVSSSSSRRHPSPSLSRNSTPAPSLGPKRSSSVDRRRPDVSQATKLLVTSTKSLSVSFQGEAFSLPVNKTKVAPTSPSLSSVRKITPERRSSTLVEHCKPTDQHLWTARNRLVKPLLRSLDCSGNVGEMSSLNGSSIAVPLLQNSIDGRLSLDLGRSEVPKVLMACDQTTSDSDSVSSGSTSGIHESVRTSQRQKGSGGIFVPPKFWQETNTRLRRLQDPGSPLSTSPSSKLKQYTNNASILSSRRTMPSPIRGSISPASPSKVTTPVGSSPSRSSPSRGHRNAVSTINNNFSDTPSVLSFAVDVQRRKVGENGILEAHFLRLLYNHHLQWRFINARTEALLIVQKYSAEKNLWNARITILHLRDTVTRRRNRLQLLRQKLKLASILREQMTFLEDWKSLGKDHSISLLGAIEALKASIIRLSVVGGATADVQSLQGALGSAVETIQAMASSVHLLVPKVEEVNSLVNELAKVTKKGSALLQQCTYFISLLAALQVKDSSLRTHLLQFNCVRTV